MRTEYCTEFLSVFCCIVLGISFIRDDVHCLEHFAWHSFPFRSCCAQRCSRSITKAFRLTTTNNNKHKRNENKTKKNLNKKRAIHAGYLGFYICSSLFLLNFIQAFILNTHSSLHISYQYGGRIQRLRNVLTPVSCKYLNDSMINVLKIEWNTKIMCFNCSCWKINSICLLFIKQESQVTCLLIFEPKNFKIVETICVVVLIKSNFQVFKAAKYTQINVIMKTKKFICIEFA